VNDLSPSSAAFYFKRIDADVHPLNHRKDPEVRERFTNLKDYYDAVESLIAQLSAEGYPEESERLGLLMRSAWTTGSELLGELGLSLEGMRGQYPAHISGQINSCLHFAIHHREILHLD
jgi:hypothetical protein